MFPAAVFSRLLQHRTHLSFLQTGTQVDDPQAPFPRGRRSLDVVGDPGLRATPLGTASRRRSSSAMASTTSGGETDANSRPTGLFAASADPGPSGVRAKTLWALAWTTQRAAIQTGAAAPCDQIDRVISSEPRVTGLSPASCLHVGKLLLVKWQAKGTVLNLSSLWGESSMRRNGARNIQKASAFCPSALSCRPHLWAPLRFICCHLRITSLGNDSQRSRYLHVSLSRSSAHQLPQQSSQKRGGDSAQAMPAMLAAFEPPDSPERSPRRAPPGQQAAGRVSQRE